MFSGKSPSSLVITTFSPVSNVLFPIVNVSSNSSTPVTLYSFTELLPSGIKICAVLSEPPASRYKISPTFAPILKP